eukprot:scaffold21035_cov64-Phaeocystis_antarctica.AAC.2
MAGGFQTARSSLANGAAAEAESQGSGSGRVIVARWPGVSLRSRNDLFRPIVASQAKEVTGGKTDSSEESARNVPAASSRTGRVTVAKLDERRSTSSRA